MKRAILTYLTIMFMLYLGALFVTLEFDPRLWSDIARFVYVVIGSIPSALIAAYIYEKEKD